MTQSESSSGGALPRVLVTGGTGYIGSHMCIELIRHGYDVVVLDNLSNSSRTVVSAIQRITNTAVTFCEGDLRDADCLERLFAEHDFEAVLHFGGLKSVNESVADPIGYYDNNVNGSLRLLEAMKTANVKRMVFSSSATVYGMAEHTPIDEEAPIGPTNPYGQSKLMVEHLLRDVHASDPTWRISVLRYFNPVGADVSGEIGEDPRGIPNNLMPYISQVAVGRLPSLRVFGNDYPTHDGTGVRDYIHVVDLARGHVHALRHLAKQPGYFVHNLGTGTGYSVLDAVAAFEKASGITIPYDVVDRRPGDVAESYANAGKALRDLDWRAEYDLERMCADVWRWQSRHPEGFADG